jgi:flagellar hook protein FlgE
VFTDLSGGGPLGTMTFDQTGNITSGAFTPPSPPAQLGYAGAVNNLSFPVNFSGSTQFGSSFSVNAMVQDGYGSGSLAGFNVGEDGTILGRYTNGQTSVVGQVILAAFRNAQGMQPLGDNVWAQTPGSGDAIAGMPGPRASMASCSRRAGRIERRPDCRAGEHDHHAALLSGQCANHQDPGQHPADPGEPALRVGADSTAARGDTWIA